MKKTFLTFITSVAISASLWAQAPQAFNYQGVARDLSGTALVAKNISVKASILDGSLTGTVVYAETHAIATNQFGLFTLSIGTGTVASGIFANTNWATGNKYLKIEIDPNGGSSYTLAGTTQLLSVPYAMYAAKAGDSKWKDVTGGINYSAGNVGIGTLLTIEKTAAYGNDRNFLSLNNLDNSEYSGATAGITTGTGSNQANLGFGVWAKSYYPTVDELKDFSGVGAVSSNKLMLQGAGTGGYISFRTGFYKAGSINGAERARIDENGNFGIGTMTPSAKLHTNGTVRLQGLTSNNTLTNALVTDANGNVFTKDISSLGGSQWTSVTGGINYSNGKVGIGTPTPTAMLEIANNDIFTSGLVLDASKSTAIGIAFSDKSTQSWGGIAYYATNFTATSDQINAGNLILNGGPNGQIIRTWGNGEIKFSTSNGLVPGEGQPTERMRIDKTGNIGVGTATPKAKLQITSGDVYLDDATKGIIMKNTAGQCYRVTVGTAGALVSTLITCP